MTVRAIKTRIFREGEDIVVFIRRHVPVLKNGSVLAVTSKIVALSEGRTRKIRNKKEKIKIIKEESAWALQTHPEWWWTEKDGMLLVNAGIDDSNAKGKLVLLPRDSFASARKLRSSLLSAYAPPSRKASGGHGKASADRRHHKIRKLGVVITDSRISPMRAGVTGVALGYAGFRGVRDYRGKKDLFGRKLKVTLTDVADSLATAATLVMGEGAERQPLAIIEDAPVFFTERMNPKEVLISPKDDMYAPLFRRLGARKKPKR
ncbi:coenzyme F420-0:L-glutamate ligase [Candidatus Kaiserbacteria bacterium]|nr:coenzyme F420-0:L-glutamate ligase [Candidatus Kaiserbacteria bacterium]